MIPASRSRPNAGGGTGGGADRNDTGATELTVHSFPPVLGRNPRILVLGSMPGLASLRKEQYYAHPQNAFWSIMAELLGGDPHWDYRRRLAMLKRGGVALWDVFARCKRRGSLDSAIAPHSEVANEIPALLRRHPGIRLVACNGGKAHQGFLHRVLPALQGAAEKQGAAPQLLRLPSSSPAYARLSKKDKLEIWKKALRPWLEGQTPRYKKKGVPGRRAPHKR